MPLGKAAAMKALALDDSLAEAYSALAMVTAIYEFDWPKAEEYFRAALKRNSAYSTARSWYALFDLVPLGRLGEALRQAKRAEEIDPLSPSVNTVVGLILFYEGKYDEARTQLGKALELDPNFPVAHYYMGKAWWAEGLLEPAIESLQRARTLFGDSPAVTGTLASCYASMGRPTEARALLDEVLEAAARRYVPCHNIAEAYIGLGEKDHALEWLEKAYEERDSQLIWLKLDPIYQSLRSEPRFVALRKKMRLGRTATERTRRPQRGRQVG
jgi:tetratricopeptide (TPR) repeat protein